MSEQIREAAELRRQAAEIRRESHDQMLEVALSILSLYTTICRLSGPRKPFATRRGYERMARERLGRAIMLVGRLDLTPEQNERFCRAFRELADCLPIRSALTTADTPTIIPINSRRASA